MKKILLCIATVLNIIIFAIGNIIENVDCLLASLFIIFILSIVYCFMNIKKRIALLCFLISFFTFLLGRFLILLITGEDWKENYSNDTIITTINLLITSIFSIIIGSMCCGKLNGKDELQYNVQDSKIDSIQKTSKALYYFTYAILIVITLEKIILVYANGYVALYANYDSFFPDIFHKMAVMSICAFFIYLATFPNKRDTIIAIIFYTIYLALTLLTGERGNIVTGLFIIFIYIFFRQVTLKNIKFFNKTNIVIICIATIITIIFLSLYADIRQGDKIEHINLLEEFTGFFKSQGGSVSVIEKSVTYKEQLKELNSNYVLGIIINKVKTQLGIVEEREFQSNNLGETITWLLNPEYYYSGRRFWNSIYC